MDGCLLVSPVPSGTRYLSFPPRRGGHPSGRKKGRLFTRLSPTGPRYVGEWLRPGPRWLPPGAAWDSGVFLSIALSLPLSRSLALSLSLSLCLSLVLPSFSVGFFHRRFLCPKRKQKNPWPCVGSLHEKNPGLVHFLRAHGFVVSCDNLKPRVDFIPVQGRCVGAKDRVGRVAGNPSSSDSGLSSSAGSSSSPSSWSSSPRNAR